MKDEDKNVTQVNHLQGVHCSMITVPVWLDRAQLVLHKMNPTLAEEFHYVFTQHSTRIFSPPGSSVPGILQTRIQEWEATPFSRGSPQHSDQTLFPCIAGRLFTAQPIKKTHKMVHKSFKRMVWVVIETKKGVGGLELRFSIMKSTHRAAIGLVWFLIRRPSFRDLSGSPVAKTPCS